MKKLLLGISLLCPMQLMAAEDSVFTWGQWSQGIQPAAGSSAVAVVAAPVQQPNVAALTRSIQVAQEQQLAAAQAIEASNHNTPPTPVTPPAPVAPPAPVQPTLIADLTPTEIESVVSGTGNTDVQIAVSAAIAVDNGDIAVIDEPAVVETGLGTGGF